ncbi:fibropellin-3-like [Stylophora pistillata]|uniref:fibropellin-3-like n=1 Tax=Stylophora pistillata TaxID=50429 RepID=UPI000C0526F8|nr:fibropellin-3-like [Stylophora pistillata]
MAGFYKGRCEELHCIDKVKCCQMLELRIQYTNNPCKNGATCFNLQDSYHCECKQGFSGVNCEKDIDECTQSPCKNGATCVNLHGSYRWDCVTVYSEKTCETNINECEAEPCKNGATCVDLVGDYHCHCVSGFNGANCEKVPKLTTLSPPVTTQPLVIGANACNLMILPLDTRVTRHGFFTSP